MNAVPMPNARRPRSAAWLAVAAWAIAGSAEAAHYVGGKDAGIAVDERLQPAADAMALTMVGLIAVVFFGTGLMFVALIRRSLRTAAGADFAAGEPLPEAGVGGGESEAGAEAEARPAWERDADWWRKG
ncbi:MAG: hypothetical protein R3F11_29605 [Verrucomicrobiales bacterium]